MDELEHLIEGQPEPRRQKLGRHARRAGLVLWTSLLVLILVAIVALAVENSRRVKVGWIFGYSRISLVFLVLFAVVLGWLLGIATSMLLRRRIRRRVSAG
jgi:uncharacterized integral membrane protein